MNEMNKQIGAGLYNEGNTCFMNAMLQCLAHFPSILKYFSFWSKPLCLTESNEKLAISNGKASLIWKSLLILLQRMHRNESPQSTKKFRRIFYKYSFLSSGRMHDVAEFLHSLINIIHEQESKRFLFKIDNKWTKQERSGLIDISNPLLNKTLGYNLIIRRCSSCGHHAKDVEKFHILTLSLPNPSAVTTNTNNSTTSTTMQFQQNKFKNRKKLYNVAVAASSFKKKHFHPHPHSTTAGRFVQKNVGFSTHLDKNNNNNPHHHQHQHHHNNNYNNNNNNKIRKRKLFSTSSVSFHSSSVVPSLKKAHLPINGLLGGYNPQQNSSSSTIVAAFPSSSSSSSFLQQSTTNLPSSSSSSSTTFTASSNSTSTTSSSSSSSSSTTSSSSSSSSFFTATNNNNSNNNVNLTKQQENLILKSRKKFKKSLKKSRQEEKRLNNEKPERLDWFIKKWSTDIFHNDCLSTLFSTKTTTTTNGGCNELKLGDLFDYNSRLHHIHGMVDCRHCSQRVRHAQRTFLVNSPDFFLIQLARFTWNKNSYRLVKDRRHVSFPLTLDVPVLQSSGSLQHRTYRLQSMICHVGSTPSCGHYKAYVCVGDNESTSAGAGGNNWFCFDDDLRNPVSWKHLSQAEAYILCYVRQQQ